MFKKLSSQLICMLAMFYGFCQNSSIYEFDDFQQVSSLCYETEFTQKLKVAQGLNLKTLEFLDKLKFKQKSYVRSYSEYFDPNSDVILDAKFVSQVNTFPKWYMHPSIIRTNSQGSNSFFPEDSEYLTGGWEGANAPVVGNGSYITDSRTRERYLHQPHNDKSFAMYQNVNALVKDAGFLVRYVWFYPSQDFLLQIEKNGFQVTNNTDQIILGNGSTTHSWNLNEKTYTIQSFEDGVLKETKHTIYKYDKELKTNLKYKEIFVTPAVFTNGDCYETIETTIFEDYAFNCSANGRSSDEQELDELKNLVLFPNPTHDVLNIELPCKECRGSTMTITDVNGRIVLFRKLDFFEGGVNVKNLAPGIYVLKVKQGKQFYTNKFIKQ